MNAPKPLSPLAALLDAAYDEFAANADRPMYHQTWMQFTADYLTAHGVTLDAERAARPDHPHDGYAYDGCKCVCCLNIRALASPAPASAPDAERLREACPECHDPWAWHLVDTHPSAHVGGQWCYCERKPELGSLAAALGRWLADGTVDADLFLRDAVYHGVIEKARQAGQEHEHDPEFCDGCDRLSQIAERRGGRGSPLLDAPDTTKFTEEYLAGWHACNRALRSLASAGGGEAGE